MLVQMKHWRHHHHSAAADYLRDNTSQFSGEDLAALQAVMMEEDPNGGMDVAEDEEGELELDYDRLLELGERIGNVKEERYVARSQASATGLTGLSAQSRRRKPRACQALLI